MSAFLDSEPFVGVPAVAATEARAGLTQAELRALYVKYGHAVLHRCRQLLRYDEEGAWDAMHTTFLRAIRYGHTYKEPRGPVAWLLAIAFRVCLDERRARGRVEVEELAPEALEEGTPSFDGVLARQRTVAWLLRRFDEETRLVVVLRYFDELEVEEIARQTGLSARTVARRLRDFLDRARRLVSEARR